MAERLSFFIPRESLIHRANPLTKLTLVFATVIIAFVSPWYWTAFFLIWVNVFLAAAGKVQREYLKIVWRLLLPVVGFLFVMQGLFLPYGGEELLSFWFLSLTVGNIQAAFLNATRIFVMVSSFILFILCTHPSELMSDLARRGVPAQLAYVVVSTLQILPQMRTKANMIIDAQRSRGLETQGSFRRRVGALLPLVGPLVFGSLVEVEERAIAIEARAFASKMPKTSLRVISDTTLDRITRWGLVLFVLLIIAGRIWLWLVSRM